MERQTDIYGPDAGLARLDGGDGAGPLLMPCDGGCAYNLERTGRGRYRLTLAVPGFEADGIDVSARNGYLRITGLSALVDPAGDVLHRGLDDALDRTFLMTQPLDVTDFEVCAGLLRIELHEQPGAGVPAGFPPRLETVEAVALAA